MTKKNMRKIALSDMREILQGGTGGSSAIGKTVSSPFYIGNSFGLSIGVTDFFRHVMGVNEPVLIDDCRIGLLQRGIVDVTVNLIDYHLKPGSIAYIGSGSTVEVHNVSGDAFIEGLIMRDDFLNIALHGHVPAAFSGERLNFYVSATAEECGVIDSLLHTMWDIVHQPTHNRETVYGLVTALICYYDDIARRHMPLPNEPYSRGRDIFERFLSLVNKHCRAHRTLAFYADRLCITERYLGTLVKTASGMTAKEWIDRAVVTAAKVMLRHTDKQAAQIAYELGFSNTSFFNKYFKRLTGTTPLEYRRS